MKKRALLLLALSINLAPGGAVAAEVRGTESRGTDNRGTESRGAESRGAEVTPFDGGLERLAEILGGLHYLRGICGANEGNKWRAEMQALLEAEAPSGQRRAEFISRFNRGYRAYLQTYHTCTPAADLAVRRYLDEGAKIAREITARYSN
jgi:uncharacterized protein (TIGR02301 family)